MSGEVKNKAKIGGLEIFGNPKVVGVDKKDEGLACPDCGCDTTLTIMINIDAQQIVGQILSALKDVDGNAITEKAFGGPLKGIFPGCAACGWKGPLAVVIDKGDGKLEPIEDADPASVSEPANCDGECEKCDKLPDVINLADTLQSTREMRDAQEDGTPKGMISIPMPSPVEVPPLWKKKN